MLKEKVVHIMHVYWIGRLCVVLGIGTRRRRKNSKTPHILSIYYYIVPNAWGSPVTIILQAPCGKHLCNNWACAPN